MEIVIQFRIENINAVREKFWNYDYNSSTRSSIGLLCVLSIEIGKNMGNIRTWKEDFFTLSHKRK